jgi:tetratricopeptide (TPR) repeat protein
VPATVQAILAARIDRLHPEEKRLLQAAAVIGTHVPFELLRAIAGAGEETLRRCLAQLQTAEFVYEAQLFPDLEYAFKHALTHEVAYGNVLQDRRRALHAAIVDAMEQLYADRISEHVERLAHHATRGRLVAKAVRYLREAGERAAGRSANREAVAYFEEALALLDELPQADESLNEALGIRMALGPVLIALKGPPSAEVEQMYWRALELVDRLGADSKRFPVLWGLWFVHYTRGEYPVALEAGERLLVIAHNENDTGRILEAHHSLWPVLCAMGRPRDALPHLDRGVALYDRECHGTSAFLYGGHDPGACSLWHRGIANWSLGYPERALRDTQDACRLAEELEHPMTMVIALWFAAWLLCNRGERELAIANLDRATSIARPHGFSAWSDLSVALSDVLKREKMSAATVGELHGHLSSLQNSTNWRKVACLCALAYISAEAGHAEEGLKILGSIPEAERRAAMATEILRIEGELLLKRGRLSVDDAKSRFNEAINLARDRGEKSLELRAATSLARVLGEQGRRVEAHAALSGVYAWFTEGFDTADLKMAKALLDALA